MRPVLVPIIGSVWERRVSLAPEFAEHTRRILISADGGRAFDISKRRMLASVTMTALGNHSRTAVLRNL